MRDIRFTVLITKTEKEALDELAGAWRRTPSDVVRLLIADALSRLFTNIQQGGGDERNSSLTPDRTIPAADMASLPDDHPAQGRVP